MLQIFRLPSHGAACTVARALQASGLTSRAGVRREQAFVAVRSDRTDIAAMVRSLVPAAVPVSLEHLPTPLPDDTPLSA